MNCKNFTLSYDAQDRLVSVSGPSLSASFLYDGDGNRVQSTMGGTTTTFVGNYYEVSGSTVTKPYDAADSQKALWQRIRRSGFRPTVSVCILALSRLAVGRDDIPPCINMTSRPL